MPAGQSRPSGQRSDARRRMVSARARGDAGAGGDAVYRVAAAGQQARGVRNGEAACRRVGANQGDEQPVTVHHNAYMHDQAWSDQALSCTGGCAILCTCRLRLDRASRSATPCARPWRRPGVGARRFEAAHGLRPWTLRGILDPTREQAPSVDRAAEICAALGLTLSIGPSAGSRANDEAGEDDRGRCGKWGRCRNRRLPVGGTHCRPCPPWRCRFVAWRGRCRRWCGWSRTPVAIRFPESCGRRRRWVSPTPMRGPSRQRTRMA